MGVRGNGEEGSREDDDDVSLTPPPLLRWEVRPSIPVLRKAWAYFSPLDKEEVERGGRCCEKKK